MIWEEWPSELNLWLIVRKCFCNSNAIKLINNITFNHKQAGFEIYNWISNSISFMENIEIKIFYINSEFIYPLKLHKIKPDVILNLY